MKIKVENWNGFEIRFILFSGEWWAVAVDVCKALGLQQVTRALSGLKNGVTISKVIDTMGREQEVNIISEKAIYKLSFKSRKPEAEAFQDWVFDVIKQLRETAGLEGFQVFRMLDKEHQRETMAKLKESMSNPVKVDYIKANTIANKAVSSLHGYPKMVKKTDMTPNMLVNRQIILEDTVNLMGTVDRFDLDLPIAQTVYNKYQIM